MLAVEVATQQTCTSTDCRTEAGITGNSPNDCTTRSPSGAAGQRTLLGLIEPCAPADGKQ